MASVPPHHTRPLPTDCDRARALVMRLGWNSTCYQILNPGIGHWFSDDVEAVIGYVDTGGAWVVAGGPVCGDGDVSAAATAFEAAARAKGRRVVYVCAAGRMEALARQSARHAVLAMGAQPVWDACHWPELVKQRASIRSQVNRARNKGVRIEKVDDASRCVHLTKLRDCLAAWLESRPFPAMHFMVEPQTLEGVLTDRLLYVAWRGETVEAFLLASPVPARGGWLVEQIARRPRSPNGSAELLIDTAMRDLIHHDPTPDNARAARSLPTSSAGVVPTGVRPGDGPPIDTPAADARSAGTPLSGGPSPELPRAGALSADHPWASGACHGRYVTLGLVALAEHARPATQDDPLAIRLLSTWVRAHGRRFYNFAGLERFRTKLLPIDWEPVYAIAAERRFSIASLNAIAHAFCEGSPFPLLARAMAAAAKSEAAALRHTIAGAVAAKRGQKKVASKQDRDA